MIQETEVPDDKIMIPYFISTDLAAGYIKCFASFMPIEYETGLDGKQVLVDGEPVEVYTEQERARLWVTSHLDLVFAKWQRRQAANSVAIKSGGIS